jgi:hypothetical protein
MMAERQTLASKPEMKSAANACRYFRRLDGKQAMKNAHQELKHFLEEADVTNS